MWAWRPATGGFTSARTKSRTCWRTIELAKLPLVDPARVAVIGGSHGGYLAQMLATRIRPAATVSFAGLTDIEGMFYEAGLELRRSLSSWQEWFEQLLTHRERPRTPADPQPVRRVSGGNLPLTPGSAGYEVALELGWRYRDRRDYFRAISPKENALKVSGPVLYLVGGAGPLRFAGKQRIETLKERGIETVCSEHSGMPHGFHWSREDDPPQQFFDALQVTERFIWKHTGGKR